MRRLVDTNIATANAAIAAFFMPGDYFGAESFQMRTLASSLVVAR